MFVLTIPYCNLLPISIRLVAEIYFICLLRKFICNILFKIYIKQNAFKYFFNCAKTSKIIEGKNGFFFLFVDLLK